MSKAKSAAGGLAARDPFQSLQEATRIHRHEHGCGAYTFEDGMGLADLSTRLRPQRILELGTALGYTACCLASGSPGAHVDTIERDALHVELARRNIAAAGLAGRITVREGEFSQILPLLSPGYDFAFFDGFAPAASVLKQLADLLAPEGVLVCANLSLAPPRESRRIISMLNDPNSWRHIATIEAEATAVWQKR